MSSVNAAIVSGHDDHLNNNCCTSGSDQSSTVTDSFDSSEIKSDHPTLSSFASASAHQTDYDESDNVRFGCPKGCDIAAHRKSPEIGTKHDRTADDEQKDELDEKDRFGDEPIEDRMIGKSIANGSDGALKESASNHSVGGGSPNSTGQYRSTVLANFNSWFNEISSSSLFHNFVLSNPFRRRNSRNSSVPSLCITRSNSKLLTSPVSSTADDSKSSSTVKEVSSLTTKETPSPEPVDEAEAVRKFIGAIQPTLKGKELIELANFGVVEIEPQEPGLGHRFEIISLDAHTFCDNCSEFIWTPIVHHSDTISASIVSPYAKTVRCVNCRYTCHYRCSKFVRINCHKVSTMDSPSNETRRKNLEKQSSSESDADDVDLNRSDSPLFVDRAELEAKIKKYNERIAHRGSGLGIYLLDDGKTFRGFLRVHMNLTRPINVIAGTRPPSIYDIINDEEIASRRTLTTFYMPRDTVKNIHINSLNTSVDVIKAMLKKFKMVDNRQKFALYKKHILGDASASPVLSRIGDNEHPLRIALEWLDSEDKQIVLQENDTADVNWDEFQLPELNNFLKILDREEKEHFDQVKVKYEVLRAELEKLITYKSMFSDAVLV